MSTGNAKQAPDLFPYPPFELGFVISKQLAALYEKISTAQLHFASGTLASMSAPLSIFGSASMLRTLNKTLRTPCTGDHRSEALSYRNGSSPGGCKIEIHTAPFG